MYTVIKVWDRNIESLGTFPRKEDAFKAMEEDFRNEFREAYGREFIGPEEENEDECDLDREHGTAWITCSCNLDWKII